MEIGKENNKQENKLPKQDIYLIAAKNILKSGDKKTEKPPKTVKRKRQAARK